MNTEGSVALVAGGGSGLGRAVVERLYRDGATVVIARVAGDFPGSPVELQHAFRLDGGQIVSLEIR